MQLLTIRVGWKDRKETAERDRGGGKCRDRERKRERESERERGRKGLDDKYVSTLSMPIFVGSTISVLGTMRNKKKPTFRQMQEPTFRPM